MYNSLESKNRTKIDIQKAYGNSTITCELCEKRLAVGTIGLSRNEYKQSLQIEVCKQCLRGIKAMIGAIL